MRYFKMVFLFLLFLILPFCFYEQEEINYNYKYMIETSYVTALPEVEKEPAIETNYGTITAYNPECIGCIGITASGYDVRNTIYYEDNEYGLLRIIAFDKSIPFGSVIKISGKDINVSAIVLDRGSAIGYNKLSQADLLFENLEECIFFGRKYDIKFEILRLGY